MMDIVCNILQSAHAKTVPDFCAFVVQCESLIATQPDAAIDEWQTQMQCKALNAGQIHLYSSLSAADRRLTEVDCVNHLNRTIADLMQGTDDRSVALIPEGPYVIPYYQGKTLH